MKVERKVFNSVRILSSLELNKDLEKQYEDLTNLILAYGGRIHGSQHNSLVVENAIENEIAVYFEIPTENKEEFLKEEKQ